ncbi:MAG: protein kinase [Lysobacterales bacterium]
MDYETYLDHRFILAERAIDPVAGTLTWNGQIRRLRRKELEVLALLVCSQGRIVPRQAFIDALWRGNSAVGEQGLTDTIRALRRSLLDEDAGNPLIRTIPRHGYQLNATVQSAGDPEGSHFLAGSTVHGKPDLRLVRKLKEKPTSESWLATDGPAARQVVLRFCRSEAHLKELRREVTLLRYLQQSLGGRPDIAGIIDWQLEEPPYFIQLESASQGTLADLAVTTGGLHQIDLKQRLLWLSQAAVALAAVHEAELVHRNISAESILLDKQGDQVRARLGEFGLGELGNRSRLTQMNITAAGLTLAGDEPVGPQKYLAPERLSGCPASTATDIYAFGVLMFETILGKLEAAPGRNWNSLIEASSLRDLISACLKDEADSRITAAALAAGLQACASDFSSTQTPAQRPSPIPSTSTAKPETNADGKFIGPYRILEVLGDGGMGTVYLAEQRHPVKRTVALKVIKAGLDSAQVLARFEAERQALAMMTHANVAAVYEAGTTELSQPYFAMEYVPGLHITAHCDKYQLDSRQRIELFLQVCDGVMHAHQKGLIHRDLKPGNILVKKSPGQPSVVKIIDFGVAKSLHGKLGPHTTDTRLGGFVGTPVYSGPEQVLGKQSDVDTRADIYSLGVVLYELLAGVPPYSNDDLSDKSQAELVKLLSRNDPPDLATRFKKLDLSAEVEIARQRSTTVPRLLETLEADISWIVTKCLEREPDDRYGSAPELKLDLQRWLDDQPLYARPANRWYRLRKLVRRNRTAVGITAMVAALLIGTTSAAVFGLVSARNMAAQAKDAAAKAELVAEFQEQQWQSLSPEILGSRLKAYLLDALSESARASPTGEDQKALARTEYIRELQSLNFTDISIRQLKVDHFEPALKVIDSRYKGQPDLQARLWDSMAGTLLSLEILDLALDVQNRALAARKALLGEKHLLTLESLLQRGDIYLAMNQGGLAKNDYEAGIEGLRQTVGQDHPATQLAIFRNINRDESLDPGGKLLEELITERQKDFGPSDPWLGRMRVVLAEKYIGLDRIEDAKKLLQTSLQASGDFDTGVQVKRSDLLSQLANLSWETGDAESAVDYMLEAAALIGKERGTAASITVVDQVSMALSALGRAAEGEKLARQTLSRLHELYAEGDPAVLWLKSSMATLMARQGRLDEAEQMMRWILDQYPAGDDRRRRPLLGLARIQRTRGELRAAEQNLKECALIVDHLFGAESTSAAMIKNELAQVLFNKGEAEQAAKMLRNALAIEAKADGSLRVPTSTTRRELGRVLAHLGQTAEATTLLQQSVAEMPPWSKPHAFSYLADVYRNGGEAEKALALNEQSLVLGRKSMDPNDPELAVLLDSLAKTQLALANAAAADESISEALQILSHAKLGGSHYGRMVQESCVQIRAEKHGGHAGSVEECAVMRPE